MKRSPRLLLIILPFLFILACLGTPETPGSPISTDTVLPGFIPTSAMTETSAPSPFPGLTITYILDGNVWLWDGTARQLTNDSDAERVKISDDGMVIAYQRGRNLWVINSDGSSPRVLVDITANTNPILTPRAPGLTLFLAQFEFQPNSHWIYFSTAWGDEKPNLESNDLRRVNTDTPNPPQELLEKGGGMFTFSPNGNLLALTSSTSIKVINADGNGLVNALTYPVISSDDEYIPQVVWISNGTGFYTVIPEPVYGLKTKYLFVSSDGSFSAQLSEYMGLIPPIISQDGLKVAYVEQWGTNFNLHVLEASNTDSIIASYEGAPMLMLWNWSPDSKLVTFSNAHPILLLTAGIGIPASPLTESVTPNSLRWISADHFIFFREGNLLIGQINNPETILIASGFSNQVDATYYDFSFNPYP